MNNASLRKFLRSDWSPARLLWALMAAVALVSAPAAWAQTAISTYAGTAGTAGATDSVAGPATAALFRYPQGIALNAAETQLFVADTGNNLIRKITLSSGAVAAVALTGTSSTVSQPGSVAIDTAGNIYVADTANRQIKKYNSSGAIQAIYGTGSAGSTDGIASGGSAVATFNNPNGVAVNGAGTFIYVADTSNNLIRRIDVVGNSVTTVGGSSGAGDQVEGTTGTSKFDRPYALALNSAGTDLYVADMGNNAVRRIALNAAAANCVTSTVAGARAAQGSVDTASGTPSFRNPYGIAIDSAGSLYVADTANNTIRKITTPNTSPTVTTLAGSPQLGGVSDGIGSAARFQSPWGLAVTTAGTLYIADSNNQTIRIGTAATVPVVTSQPGNATWTIGTTSSLTFTVAASGSPTPTVQWQRQPAGGGGFSNLSNSGAYSGVTTSTLTLSGAALVNSGDQFQAVVTNGVSSATSNAATLTVQQPPLFTSVASATFTANTAGSFTATASGSPAPTFSYSGSFPGWASLNTSTGAITGTPQNAVGSPFSFTLQASNGVGTPATQSFTLTVQAAPIIGTSPASQSVAVGQNVTFAVVASGSPAPSSYQWQRQAAGTSGFLPLTDGNGIAGSTTATLTVGSATLAMSGDQYQVVVGNGIASSTSAIATLTVTQAPAITSTASAFFVVGTAGSFTATATGSPAVTFSVASGTFPAWASLNTSTGVISGTPANTVGSPFSFVLQAANGVNPAATQNFTLTVSPTPVVPVFSTQPANASVTISQPAAFTVAATGNPAPTFQWQRQAAGTSGFVNLTESSTYVGTQTATLTVNNTSTGMTGDQFLAVATNNSGSTQSTPAALTVTPGSVVTTMAGKAGTSGSLDGVGAAARFFNPTSIAVDTSGVVYVADTTNQVIRRVAADGTVSVLAGKVGTAGNADGSATDARFNGPSGIAVDAAGVLYVADSFNHTIRMINPQGIVTTLAGVAGSAGSADGASASAKFSYPSGVAVDAFGVYVADNGNHTIRRIFGGTVVTLAGTAGSSGDVDATGAAARFRFPNGLVADGLGNVYVADSLNHAVRKVTAFGVVTTLAGSISGLTGSTDATGIAARFYQPFGVAIDSSGNIYVADTLNSTIRKVTPAGVVTTFAGTAGVTGSTDGMAASSLFNQPQGVAVDSAGNIYVADTRNQTVRRTGLVTAPSIITQPANANATPGGTATFTVVASGAPAPTSFQWQRQAVGAADFTNLTNDTTYGGATTATLTITGVTTAMQGDQFRVVVANQVSPDAVSSAVSLNTVAQAPAITSAAAASFSTGTAGSFTVVATGSPAPTFSATGLPTWATLNATSGVISGTPTDATGSPFTVVVTASNGLTATQNLVLTVLTAPVITTQPVAASATQGASATLSVTAVGGAPLSYQWSRNGVAISGATASSLTLANVQPSTAGDYKVVVTNSSGSVTSSAAALTVISNPAFASQPRSQMVTAGSAINLSVSATGGTTFTYQWRKNGVNIAGATGATYTIASAVAGDAGNYDVIVTNSAGAALSAMALVTVSSGSAAPAVTAAPASRTALAGSSVTLSASASGAPAPTFQWRKNGANIAGATSATYTIASVAAGDAANYDVVVTNSQGSATSSAGSLRVIAKSYAGSYFGTLSGGLGSFALYVRDDNTAVFFAYLTGSQAPISSLNVLVSDTGTFSISQAAIGSILAATNVSGTIAADGSITGTVSGGATATLSATRASAVGSTQAVAGFYRAAAAGNGSVAYTIVGGAGQAFALTQVGTAYDGGTGTATAAGVVTVTGSRSTLTQTITGSGTISGASTGTLAATLTGANEETLALQRVANISSRARITSGAGLAIAGFVINGNEAKPVLIRAVGPTLASFGLPSALSAPVLDLFNGAGTKIASNTGVASAPNPAGIAAAGTAAGAFALGNADSAILTTLAPGAYTAQVSGANNTQGVALIEVYDLSPASTAQKLFNISTRATAGTGDATLTAGIVVTGNASKRVMIRAVGPGLNQFGLTGTLPSPVLVLTNQAGQTVATGSNWSASADAAAITAASAQSGAFPMVAGDAAMIVNLAPGAYTAQVTNAAGASGVALVEVYELP